MTTGPTRLVYRSASKAIVSAPSIAIEEGRPLKTAGYSLFSLFGFVVGAFANRCV